jgi:hypothetical protein
MTWLRQIIARLTAATAYDCDPFIVSHAVKPRPHDHTSDMRDQSKEPRGDGV